MSACRFRGRWTTDRRIPPSEIGDWPGAVVGRQAGGGMGKQQRDNVTRMVRPGCQMRIARQEFHEDITSPLSEETLCVSSRTIANPRHWNAPRGETGRPEDQHRVWVESCTWRERRVDRFLPEAGTGLRAGRGDGDSTSSRHSVE